MSYNELTTAAAPLDGTITIRYDDNGVPLEEVDVGRLMTFRYAYRYECR